MPKHALAGVALALSCIALAATARAQTQPVSDRLDALKQDVDELREQAVLVPTLSAAVQDLGERLAEVERALGELRRAQAAVPDALVRMDGIRDRLDALERAVQGVRTELAGVEQTGGAGGGVTYADTFSWVTADGRFSVGIGGYLHARYELEVADGALDTSTLRARRARVGLGGQLGSRRIAYQLLLSGIRETPLLDYYMDYRIDERAVVRVGQYKTPFTRHFLTSSTRRAFLEEPLAVAGLRYDRDLQVGVHGAVLGRRVAYYAGIGNGAGANRANDNLDMDVVARADVVALGERFAHAEGDLARTPGPALTIGAGVVHDLVPMPAAVGELAIETDVDGDGEGDNVRVVSASADAVFRYRGVEASVEVVARRESFGTILDHPDNGALRAALGGVTDHTYVGAFGQVTYVLPVAWRSHRLLVGGRFGRSDVPFLGVGGRASALPRGDTATEADALVQLYGPSGYRFLGLSYTVHDYSAIDGVAGTGGRSHQVILESQLKI